MASTFRRAKDSTKGVPDKKKPEPKKPARTFTPKGQKTSQPSDVIKVQPVPGERNISKGRSSTPLDVKPFKQGTGEKPGVVDQLKDKVGEIPRLSDSISQRPLVTTGDTQFDESGNIIDTGSAPTLGEAIVGSASAAGAAAPLGSLSAGTTLAEAKAFTGVSQASKANAINVAGNFERQGIQMSQGSILTEKGMSSASGLLKVPDVNQGVFLKALTNTKTESLGLKYLSNLASTAKRPAYVAGALGGYAISTQLSFNDRGDAVTSLTIGIRDAEEAGDMEAALELSEYMEDIGEPNRLNQLELMAPIINYPINAIIKIRAGLKVARAALKRMLNPAVEEETAEEPKEESAFDARERRKDEFTAAKQKVFEQ